ncbi:hypothetical protein HN51_068386 [Arachis hypogaea]
MLGTIIIYYSFEVSGKGVSRSPLEGDGASLGDELAEGRDSGCQGELDTGVQGRISAESSLANTIQRRYLGHWHCVLWAFCNVLIRLLSGGAQTGAFYRLSSQTSQSRVSVFCNVSQSKSFPNPNYP